MFRIRPRRVPGLVAALVLATGLFVSGCGQVKAGAAALVGDQRISIDELSQTVAATERAAAQQGLRVRDRAALVRGVLSREITAVILKTAAERKGITVSRGDVNQWIAGHGGRQRVRRQALRFGVPPGNLREYARLRIIQQRLAKSLNGGGAAARNAALVQYLQRVARDLGVTVSPRYGQYSMRRLAVVPEASDLSTPDPDAGVGPGLGGPGIPGSGP